MRGLEILAISGRVSIGLGLAAAVGGAILVGGGLMPPRGAQATPVFAGQTGMPCSRCHTSQTGGKELNDFGKDFKANGNKLKKQ